MEENQKYEEIIKGYDDYQLICEQAIINEQETTIFNQKKALKEEFKRRLRKDNGGK